MSTAVQPVVPALLGEVASTTIVIRPLAGLSWALQGRLKAAQQEVAGVWNACAELHRAARLAHTAWPGRHEVQVFTKGRFALHSQSVQMEVHAFLAAVATTQAHRLEGRSQFRYPYKTKEFHPIHWPAQAVCWEAGRVILPMGRGRKSLVFRVEKPEHAGAVTLVWKAGYALHIAIDLPKMVWNDTSLSAALPGVADQVRATVDLGQIHLGAVVTSTGQATMVSGRGIRAEKRLRNKTLGRIQRKRARCKKGSARSRRLGWAMAKVINRSKRRVRDLRHKATRQIANFCKAEKVAVVFVGNPHGVRNRHCGRKHNQRMSQWEYGQDIDYIEQKLARAGIACFTGSERGTSSQCPACGTKHKPRGRNWRCPNKACRFTGHRDLVGAANMHPLAFGQAVPFPTHATYQRPGAVAKGRCSSADTRQRRLVSSTPQPAFRHTLVAHATP